MNKIIVRIGALFFFLSLIFFSQLGLPIVDILVRSFVVFIFTCIVTTIIVLLLIKAASKIPEHKEEELTKNLDSKAS
jgi:multisubunit Na+/H+ antiporter MnhG subunit